MKITTIFLLPLLIVTNLNLVNSSPTELTKQEVVEVTHLEKRGFGCPLSAPECHRHCQSIGRKGGYCAGIFRTTCTCYRD